MPLHRIIAIALSLAALALAGCGGDDKPEPSPTTATTATPKVPPLGRKDPAAGEQVFNGESAPVTYGPFTLDGTYVVRFEQFAPENPKQDFSAEAPFTVYLRPAASTRQGTKLFSTAAARGRRELTRDGSYVLDVTSGDFPYAVRFTPKR